MLKIMKTAKNSISGTFILLWYVLHCTEHFGVHFSCFMTILSHFGFIFSSMTHMFYKRLQLDSMLTGHGCLFLSICNKLLVR